jgi:hypothetical protein
MIIIAKASRKRMRRDTGSILRTFDLCIGSRIVPAIRIPGVPGVMQERPVLVDHPRRLALP